MDPALSLARHQTLSPNHTLDLEATLWGRHCQHVPWTLGTRGLGEMELSESSESHTRAPDSTAQALTVSRLQGAPVESPCCL